MWKGDELYVGYNDVVWETVVNDLPSLVELLRRIVGSENED